VFEAIVVCLDWPFGWLLYLPPTLALFLLAAITALLLRGVRLFTTRQDHLRRVEDDLARLKTLRREAKEKGDAEALRRYRATGQALDFERLKAEGLPLLVSLLPIALLATWAMRRMEYLPPQASSRAVIELYTPVTMVGQTVHLVPADGLTAKDGWVQFVVHPAKNEPQTYGIARWEIETGPQPETCDLTLRLPDRSLVHPLETGRRTYAPPLVDHGGELMTQTSLDPVKAFGFIPGWPGSFCPPWLIGYLLFAIALLFVAKRFLRIY
jgi:uncharacterized membrane protein (DUF106 family)